MQRFMIGVLVLLGLFLLQPCLCITIASAQQTAGHMQTVYPSNSSLPAADREAVNGRVIVLDNALLDELFARDRAAAQREDKKPDEAPANQGVEAKPPAPRPPPALLLPKDSFVAKITSRTPSNLAAALRFAEQGRNLIRSQQYQKAVSCFERAVSLGLRAYLPYIYYYLAQTHYHLANHQSAFNFLDVAESRLAEHSDWMTSIASLRQDNINAMGYAQAPGISKIR